MNRRVVVMLVVSLAAVTWTAIAPTPAAAGGRIVRTLVYNQITSVSTPMYGSVDQSPMLAGGGAKAVFGTTVGPDAQIYVIGYTGAGLRLVDTFRTPVGRSSASATTAPRSSTATTRACGSPVQPDRPAPRW